MLSVARLAGTFAIIPTTILLTISFFVLVVVRKVEAQALKAFGYVIAAFLWVSAALVFSTGIYVLATGHHPFISMMQGKMYGMHDKMMFGGMGGSMCKGMQQGMKPQEPSAHHDMQGMTEK